MKKIITKSLFVTLFIFFGLLFFIQPSLAADPSTQRLLQRSDLVYQGAFRLPSGTYGSTYGFPYAGNDQGTFGLAYYSNHNSLFIGGHPYESKVAEISIPTISNSSSLSSLSTAGVLQNFADIAEGHLNNIKAGGATYSGTVVLGGLLVYKNKLIGTSYAFYDGASEAELSHFTSSLTLSQTGDFRGMFKVGANQPGFVAAYMTPIPPEWQNIFGGPALTGMGAGAVISRTSLGPAASVFNPDNLGSVNPVPATMLVGYPIDHPGLGTWEQGNQTNFKIYNMGVMVRGLVFPNGTRSLLFFGRTCQSAYYSSGVVCDGSQAYVWAYDANDLVAVKNGQKNPWDVRPYATWELNPRFPGSGYIQGAAYDPATSRIYVSVSSSDNTMPVIHVYTVPSSPGDTTPPSAPTGLKVQ